MYKTSANSRSGRGYGMTRITDIVSKVKALQKKVISHEEEYDDTQRRQSQRLSRLSLSGSSMQLGLHRRNSTEEEELNLEAFAGKPVSEVTYKNAVEEVLRQPNSRKQSLIPSPMCNVAELDEYEDHFADDMSAKEIAQTVEAVLDETDTLASPASDLETLILKAKAIVVNFGLIQDEEPPKKKEDCNAKYRGFWKAFKDVSDHLLKASFLCGRVVKSMDVKTEKQAQLHTRASLAEDKAHMLQKTIQDKNAEITARDEKLLERDRQLAESKQSARQKADEERQWWQERLEEASSAAGKMREEMEMEMKYLLEEARKEATSEQVQGLMLRIAEAETECSKTRAVNAQQKETIESQKRVITTQDSDLKEAMGELRTLKDSMMNNHETCIKQQAEIAHYMTVVDEQYRKLTELQDELASAQEASYSTQERIEALLMEAEQAQAQAQVAENKIYDLTEELAELTEAHNALRDEHASFELEKERMEQERAEFARQLSEKEDNLLRISDEYEEKLFSQKEELTNDKLKAIEEFSGRARLVVAQALLSFTTTGSMRVAFAVLLKNRYLRQFEKKHQKELVALGHAWETQTDGLKEKIAEDTETITKLKKACEDTKRAVNSADQRVASLEATIKGQRERVTELMQNLKQVRAQQRSQQPFVKEVSRVSSKLHGNLREFAELFTSRFRMKKYNAVTVTEVDESLPMLPAMQMMQSCNTVIATFTQLLQVERDLRHLKRDIIFYTVAEKIKLQRMKEKAKTVRLSPSLARFFERQEEFAKRKIDGSQAVSRMLRRKVRTVFRQTSATGEHETAENTCQMVQERRKEIRKEEHKLNVEFTKTVLEEIKMGTWAYPAEVTNQDDKSIRLNVQSLTSMTSPREQRKLVKAKATFITLPAAPEASPVKKDPYPINAKKLFQLLNSMSGMGPKTPSPRKASPRESPRLVEDNPINVLNNTINKTKVPPLIKKQPPQRPITSPFVFHRPQSAAIVSAVVPPYRPSSAERCQGKLTHRMEIVRTKAPSLGIGNLPW